VRPGEALEPLGEQRSVGPDVAPVPGVGVEPLRFLQIGPSDGRAIGIRAQREQLVMRQTGALDLEIGELSLHVRRKVEVPSGPSESMSITAAAAAVASGLPPNVLAWVPGVNTLATSSRARRAPSGIPPAMPLARLIASGSMRSCWWAKNAPVRPIPVCTSSSR